MPYYFMKRGMNFPGEVSMGLGTAFFHIIEGEFIGKTSPTGIVIGIDDVPKAYALRSVSSPNPIGIGEVDTNGGAWGSIACLAHNIDNVVSDPHDLLFPVRVHERHVVLEPLRIVHHHCHSLRGFKILDLNHSFIASCIAQRVVVDLHKSVDVINIALGIPDPIDVVQAPLFEVSSPIIVNQMTERCRLLFIFGVSLSPLKPVANLLEGFAIKTAHLVNLFNNGSILGLDQTAVQSFFHRIVSVQLISVEVSLSLLCGHIWSVKIDRTGFHKAFGCVQFDLLAFSGRVIQSVQRLSKILLDLDATLIQDVLEISPAAVGNNLGVGIMVVDSI